MSNSEALVSRLGQKLFLTDGGLETTLIFHDGIELPYFAAIDQMRTAEGQDRLRAYFTRYIEIARDEGLGFILESPTWRASSDWGDKLNYAGDELAAANRASIGMLEDLRQRYQDGDLPIIISGCIGPRGDGYDPGTVMTAEEAEAYHAAQARWLAEGGADMITAITMTNIPEAIGITRAAQKAGLPVVISFTVETDGRLPTGDSLAKAIRAVDEATERGPAYYMINCAHPTHFAATLAAGDAAFDRVRGLRANASKRSHAELDAAPDLDAGDPDELGAEYGDLLKRHGQITVLGGCCGTDHRHVAAMAQACKQAIQA